MESKTTNHANPGLCLILGGDVMLGRMVNTYIERRGPLYPVESIAEITGSADLTAVNLECAISSAQQKFSGTAKRFYFRAGPRAVRTLDAMSVDAVSLANNHALDADSVGLRDTMRHLNEHGIAFVGAGNDLAEAREAVVLERQGIATAFLGACDHQQSFAAGESSPGIWHVNVRRSNDAGDLIRKVRQMAGAPEVDHVVVSLHWQPNWVREIASVYRQLGRRLIEAGATVVWGHSPHHFLGVEWVEDGVILYSTGGVVDDYAVEEEFRNDRQLLFELNLARDTVEGVRAYPIELELARTLPAEGEVRSWIVSEFTERCADVGSRVVDQEPWVRVRRK